MKTVSRTHEETKTTFVGTYAKGCDILTNDKRCSRAYNGEDVNTPKEDDNSAVEEVIKKHLEKREA